MSYRPITDFWILTRAKLKNGEKFYGSYPGGFPERARVLLGVSIYDPVLHVCGGKIKYYPYSHAIGPNDKTLDLDESLTPDYLQDARDPLPIVKGGWPAILIDPPYSEEDAKNYSVGVDKYPQPNLLLKNGLMVVRPGGRVGLLHYQLPSPPSEKIGFKTRFVACIGVVVGFNNRIRVFSVFERVADMNFKPRGSERMLSAPAPVPVADGANPTIKESGLSPNSISSYVNVNKK